MFDNLTSINFSLVSVRQTRRRYAAESHGVCCRVQKSCDARNSDLTFICRDAEAKVQIQIQIP